MTTVIHRRIVLARLGVLAALACSAPAWAQQYSSPIHDVDNPARQPYKDGATFFVTDGNSEGFANLSTVSPGKRLVVETVSFYTPNLPAGQLGYLSIFVPVGILFPHYLPGVKLMNSGSFDTVGNLSPVRMYVNPGEFSRIGFQRGFTSGQTLVSVTVTGYFVNLP